MASVQDPPVVDGARVLITGASAGIGREFARQLSQRASVVVLVARRREALEEQAAELRSAGTGSPRFVVIGGDLTDPMFRDSLVRDVTAALGGIDILVNNAGVGDESLFDCTDRQRILNLLRVNVESVVDLTHGFLPGMVERGRGGLLFMGSAAGHSLLPGNAMYSASKHFVDAFCEALILDLGGTGVAVTQVAPGPVNTGFQAVAGISEGGVLGDMEKRVRISPAQCVREGLTGFESGEVLVFPGAIFGKMMRANRLLPPGIMRRRGRNRGLELRNART